MNTLALIPCYNHAYYLPEVISQVKEYCKDIVVIDDGSDERNNSIINRLKNAKVLHHKKNLGKGAALKTGFGYSIEKGYEAVITIDSDGQHKATDIPKFLRAAKKYDIVIGSRMHNVRNMPLRRILANSISSIIVSLLSHQKISDSQSGFRLIKTRVLQNLRLRNNDYQLETELILKASKKGYKIGQVPIETIYGKEVSHINPVKVTYRFLKTLLRK